MKRARYEYRAVQVAKGEDRDGFYRDGPLYFHYTSLKEARERHAVRERHDAEDEQIMRGYRELARGRQLIRLSEVVQVGGTMTVTTKDRDWQGKQRVRETVAPRIAVCRADAPRVWTDGIDSRGQVEILSYRGRCPMRIGDVIGGRFEITGGPVAIQGLKGCTDMRCTRLIDRETGRDAGCAGYHCPHCYTRTGMTGHDCPKRGRT